MVVRFGPGIEPGWLVAAVGVGLDVVGWYQISGQPTEAQQLPYLASATIPGAALIVAGAVLIAGRRDGGGRSGRDRTWTRERGTTAAGAAARDSRDRAGRGPGLWALPDGTYLHRGDCPLLDGKPEAFQVGASGADAPGDEAAGGRTAGVEAAEVGAPRAEAAEIEAAGVEASGIGASAQAAEATDSAEAATRPCPICEPDLVAAP